MAAWLISAIPTEITQDRSPDHLTTFFSLQTEKLSFQGFHGTILAAFLTRIFDKLQSIGPTLEIGGGSVALARTNSCDKERVAMPRAGLGRHVSRSRTQIDWSLSHSKQKEGQDR
jgi:hypothetical protein